jgi:hypothetical protein
MRPSPSAYRPPRHVLYTFFSRQLQIINAHSRAAAIRFKRPLKPFIPTIPRLNE